MNLNRKRKVKKLWKLHKKIKVAKFFKKLKPVVESFITTLAPLFRKLSYRLRRQPPPSTKRDDLHNIAFMALILKVNTRMWGWQKSLDNVLKLCKGVRFRMDEEGMVEISGIGNPKLVLKKIGKSKRLMVHWYQFGQCCSNLLMPENKREDKPKVDDNNLDNFPQGYHQQVPPQLLYNPYGQYPYFQGHCHPHGPF